MSEQSEDRRVLVDVSDHVAEVTLNRPAKHNALDFAMFEGISAAIDEVAANPSVRAVVLHGAGKSFCSGLDFPSFMSEGRSPELLLAGREGEDCNLAQRVAYGWQTMPAPVIAAVHGNCIGGGAQIALGADVRILGPDARVSIKEVHWGLIPDMGITRSLPKLVRADVAKELIMTARMLDAEEAVRVGLGTRLDPDPLSAAHELAREIASRSPDATRRVKALIERAWALPAAESLAIEEELQRELLGLPNQVKAVMAGMAAGMAGPDAPPADFDDPA